MTSVKFDRIVSCSSEDPKYPADNLLKFGSKWKCKSPGEQNATVIIQLHQPCVIESLDIGNEHSAFVSVMVGRAASDDYKDILPTSSFMSPVESDQGTNPNRVRMFTKDDFIQDISKEKWDRIKVVCTQPFNKRVQYGLSFIVVKSPEEKPKPTIFGNFKLKSEDESSGSFDLGRFHLKKNADENEPVSVGSLFAKRKESIGSGESSTHNGHSKATGSLNNSSSSKDQESSAKQKHDTGIKQRPSFMGKVDPPKHKVDIPQRNKDQPAKANSPLVKPKPQTPITNKPTPGKNTGKPATTVTKPPTPVVKPPTPVAKPPTPVAKPSTSSEKTKRPFQTDKKQHSPPKKPKTNKCKPFGKLLEGVTIVISGYVNPGRAVLRSKALDMGAKYKQDWDSSCTHLICAFKNTPKFKQVQGHGCIVQKDWIEQCYAKRKRLPWRRFALDINDFKQPESEDEIDEEVPQPSTSNTPAPMNDSDGEVDTSYACKAESGSDTEEEMEKFQARKAAQSRSPNPYLSDTEEEDDERPDTSHLPMPPLPS